MKKIPVLIHAEQDELLYSWIYRLAKANGFENHNDFAAKYIYFEKELRRYPMNYDPKDIGNFYRSLPDHFDMISLYLNTSLYPFYSIFMTPEFQTTFINSVFRPKKNDNLSRNIHHMQNEIHFCPECRREEIERLGYFYYHRTHQLPGAKVCTKHKTILHRFNGRRDSEFTINCDESEEMKLLSSFDAEYRYSLFVEGLLKRSFDINAYDIKDMIFDRLKVNNLTTDKYIEYEKHLKKEGLLDLMHSKKIEKFLRIKLIGARNISIIDASVLLLDLFEKPDKLETEKIEFTYGAIDKIRAEGYELISPLRRNIIRLKHHECETKFITTINAVESGWRCPLCDSRLSDNELFMRIVNETGNNEYEVLDSFKGWDTSIAIRHKTCGNIIYPKARTFVIEGVRCPCENKHTFNEVSQKISSLGDFELIEFRTTQTPLKIRHKECGNIFESSYKNFLIRPWCRCCHVSSFPSKQVFENEIKKITAEDYRLIGEYHRNKSAKIKMLHEKCGTVTEMYAWSFLNGHRCRKCTKQMTLKSFKTFVVHASGGIYECVDDVSPSDQMMHIRRTDTDEIISIYKPLAIQELTRPTPSRKLPIPKDKIGIALLPESSKELVLKKIRKLYGSNDFIFLEDLVPLTEKTYNRLKATLSRLKKEGNLMNPYPGIYCLPENSSSDEDLIANRYVCRNGQVIGYYYKDTFLYMNGFLKEKPDKLWICSSKIPNKHAKHVNYKGIEIRARGPSCKNINERSIMILPLLDRMSSCQALTEEETEFYLSYVRKHQITHSEARQYIDCYPPIVASRLEKLYSKGDESNA